MENTLLNMIPSSYIPEIHLSQYDIGRNIQFKLMDGNSEYSVPSGATVKILATKPSGLGFEAACTFSGNIVTLVNTETMSNEAGRFRAELRITSGNVILGTSNFIMNVERSPHPEGTIDGDAETLLPELTLLVERIEDSNARIESMTATATTLATGEDATAEYDSVNNQLVLGLPRGEKGEQGEGVATLEPRVSANENAINVLDSRMDTFASLPNGSTTGDAELIDIRVGYDGTTYPTAGDSVREQVSNVYNFDLGKNIGYIRSANLLDKDTVTLGYFINESGEFVASPSLYESDFIPVDDGTYYINSDYSQNFCLYNENKEFIGISPRTTGGKATVTNAKYIRCYGLIDALDTDMVAKGSYPSSYVAYKKEISDANIKYITELMPIGSLPAVKTKTVNLFDKDAVTLGYFIDPSGNLIASSSLYESDFIPVDNGIYYINPDYRQQVCFYDANKEFIGASATMSDGGKVTVSNEKYFRYYGFIGNLDTDMVARNVYPENYTPFGYIFNDEELQYAVENSRSIGEFTSLLNKKCIQLGDSITWYDGHTQTIGGESVTVKGYASYLRDCGMIVNNKGVSGSCIAYHSDSSYTDMPQTVANTNFAGMDYVTIAGGINDFKFWNSPIGSLTSSNYDNTTVIGALQYIIEKIIADNNKCKIVIFTPLKCDGWNTANASGHKLIDYVNAIKTVAEYYSIDVLDLFSNGGINDANINAFTIDGLHLNNDGYEFVSRKMIATVSSN